MRQLNRRERILAVVTMLVVVVASLYQYVLEPTLLNLVDAYEQAERAEMELSELRRLAKDSQRIEKDYERLRGVLSAAATEEELTLALLSETAALATSCALEVESVKPLRSKSTGAYTRLAVELQAYGDAQAFLKFLVRAQEAEHLLASDLITLSAGSSDAPVRLTIRVSKLAMLKAPASA